MKSTQKQWKKYFPYDKVRPDQEKAIDFIIDNIYDKRFVICEIPTGIGKSGIAITISKWMADNFPAEKKYGSYIITTQKILQQQYKDDFQGIANIWSKKNYSCKNRSNMDCRLSSFLNKMFPKKTESIKCFEECIYTEERNAFLKGKIGITNTHYFFNAAAYIPQLEKKQLLVVDECHNLEKFIIDFAAFNISERYIKDNLKMKKFPTQKQAEDVNYITQWIKNKVSEKIREKIDDLDSELKGYKNSSGKIAEEEVAAITKKISEYDNKICSLDRFVSNILNKNQFWVSSLKNNVIEIKPIHAGAFTEKYIFNKGEKIILMSGTIINHDNFCRNLGIKKEESCFISLDSPFNFKKRPIFICPVGSMSYKNIKNTLPAMSDAIQSIMSDQHSGEKGIVQSHTYSTANYLNNKDKSKRFLIHNSRNREEILQKHYDSPNPTVLLSPSMTEGVDLRDDYSKFQIICKIPYPYLGDNYIKEKMNRCPGWYESETAKTIIQASGRSIRSDVDSAATYILDSDWERFYGRNSHLFPKWFKDAIVYL